MDQNLVILSEFSKEIQDFRSTLPPAYQDKEWMPDDILLRALLSRDFKYDFAKGVVTNYFKARREYPYMFASALDPKLEGIFGQVQTLLPQLKTSHGHRIFYTRALDWDPDKYSLADVCSAVILAMELKSLDYGLQKDGFIHLIDAKDIGWKYVRAVNPKVIHAFGQLLVYYLPVNLRFLIVFNTNWAVDMIWKVVRPLLPKELVERVVMCGKSVEKLSQHFPLEVIETEAFIPSPEDRETFAKDICSNDQFIQSIWMKCMGESIQK